MKLQRYNFRSAHILLAESDDGNLVRHEDVAALEAENERLRAKLARYENDGTTHATGCWAWGPKHYECALTEIERLKALERNKWLIYGKLIGPLMPPEL